VDLELSEDEAALRDNVRAVLADICPTASVRSVYDGEDPPLVWERMVELGWPALAIDEAHGGLGLGFTELVLVIEELGRCVAPGPYLATTTQLAPAIRELGRGQVGDALLRSIAAGQLCGTLALAEDGRWAADAVRTSAQRDGRGWRLCGEKCAVLDGASTGLIVVVARGDAGLGAFVIEPGAADARPRRTIDPTLRLADLLLIDVFVEDDRVLAEPGAAHVDRALARVVEEATVSMAAMTVGSCRRIFEMTLEYAKLREQYGRPIGSFQALKHRLVDMYLSVERATALVYYAALAIAEDAPDRNVAAAAAKAGAGDCQRLVAQDGLQLHGGVGFTWEHDLHFLLKRAKASDALFGGAVAQRAALAAMLGVGPARAAAIA
jgi:alkylation response protein AidB-like acyl-CoA dehydrogenase